MTLQNMTRRNMNPKLTGLLGLGLMMGMGMPEAIAQTTVPVTGGNLTFGEAQIFVPNAGGSSAVIFEGDQPNSFLIRTSQLDIPMNAVFETDLLPQLSTAPGQVPSVGDTGTVKGALSFVGFTADGLQGFFSNIPTNLNVEISEGSFADLGAFNRYETPEFRLDRNGTLTTAVSVDSVTVSESAVGVQFQPEGTPPEDRTLLGVSVSADQYQFDGSGLSYLSDFNADILGGELIVPGSGIGNGTGIPTPADTVTRIDIIPVFVLPESSIPWNTQVGTDQGNPAMPTLTPVIGVFVFTVVPSGLWFDPPMAEAFAFEMQPAPQPVGIASRVFPGLSGQRQRTSLFTQISGLPEGIDADDRFTISVGDVILGEFTAQEQVDFRQYREQLGDLLVDGQGVERFVVSGIEPGVNPDNPRAFPIKLDFNTPTASFEMRAQGVEVAEGRQPTARLSRQPGRFMHLPAEGGPR